MKKFTLIMMVALFWAVAEGHKLRYETNSHTAAIEDPSDLYSTMEQSNIAVEIEEAKKWTQ